MLHEYTLDGTTIVREIVYTGATADTSIAKDIRYYYDASGIISSARVIKGTATFDYIFRTNIQGDVIGIYNESGTLLVSYTYDAWGNFTETVNGTSNEFTFASDLPFRYRGYYYDEEIGLYYLNTRYYDPNIGRFINADDISYLGANGDLQGFNLYAYCSNNPVMYFDPLGCSFWSAVGDFFCDLANAFIDSWEIEVGVGFGIGVSVLENGIEAEVSRDATIFFDDGRFLAGNVVTSELKIGDYGLGDTVINYTDDEDYYSDTNVHFHYSEGLIQNSCEIFTCEKCSHSKKVEYPGSNIVDVISGKEDVVLGLSAAAHLGLGGHIKLGFNLSEFFDRMTRKN